jgi:choline kinase
VKGLVLAAGQAQRLRPLTDDLPKTLLPVAGEQTILDLTLANLRTVGIEEVVVVTGFAAERIEACTPDLERRHAVRLELVRNDRPEWNNAYSLWVARAAFAGGVLLVNGDTVHPRAVEERLLAADHAGLVLAVDDEKPLGEEEMKVLLSPAGGLERIHKAVDPAAAHGEYIGLALIGPDAAEPLAAALEATWRHDRTLYYEDGFQAYADAGGAVRAAPIGSVAWVEVDDHADLARAREIAGRLLPGHG